MIEKTLKVEIHTGERQIELNRAISPDTIASVHETVHTMMEKTLNEAGQELMESMARESTPFDDSIIH